MGGEPERREDAECGASTIEQEPLIASLQDSVIAQLSPSLPQHDNFITM